MDSPSHTREPNASRISYLRRNEIDVAKWDACVMTSPAGLLYSRSFFLDGITGGQWDALVLDDYSAVMPLPKRKKYGLTYAYIPPLAGQLGIIGRGSAPATASGQPSIVPSGLASSTIMDDFLSRVPPSFMLVDTLINEFNSPPTLPGIDYIPRINLVLPLNAEYSVLYENYTGDAKKNLRRTGRAGLLADFGIPIPSVIDLYRREYGSLNRAFTARVYEMIATICSACIEKGLGFTVGIRDPAGILHAAAFFGIDHRRIYYLLGAPGPEGRRSSAVHALVDEVIRKYAKSGLSLDFEGSDIPSVAGFYRKFNPEMLMYHQVRFTRLPRWLSRLSGIPAPLPKFT
jgi:hypothetical protein